MSTPSSLMSCRAAAALALAIGAVVALSGPAHAQLAMQPTAVNGDARMVSYEYNEDQTYRVLVRPRNTTQLKFAPGEEVQYVSIGDSANFMVLVPKARQFVEIKPKFENMATNLLVVTNARTYHVDLQSTAPGLKWHMRVNWLYADAPIGGPGAAVIFDSGQGAEQRLAPRAARHAQPVADDESAEASADQVAGIDVARLAFGYRLTGDAPFKPLQAFDDGEHTYIQLPQGLQELPALFATDGGDVALVNYAVRPPYLVAQRVVSKFLLKLGRSEVRGEKAEPRRWWQVQDPNGAQ